MEKCPYVLQTGKNKGQVCGKNASEQGYCKLHFKKLNPSDEIPERKQYEGGCPCVLQSGKYKGETCGKKISENGFCKVHQKKCIQPDTVPIQLIEQPTIRLESQPSQTKCPCVLQSGKNKGLVCGKEPTKGSLYCRFHQKTCIKPPEIPETEVQPALLTPEPEEKKAVEDTTFEQGPSFVELEEKTVLDSNINNVNNVDNDNIPIEQAESSDSSSDSEDSGPEIPAEPQPIIEEDILKDEAWNSYQVSEEELHRFISRVQIENIDIVQMNILEKELQKIF
jgi:hypothetical protein